MEVIHVPAPPKEAFYKLRPISDLIKAQVNHFKHLEEKLSAEQRKAIPQHRITTENDAALYIAAMTRLLRSGLSKAAVKPKAVAIARKRPASGPTKGLAIAASGTDAAKASAKPNPKSTPKNQK